VREALEKEWEDAEDSSQEEDEGEGHREISFKHFLQCKIRRKKIKKKARNRVKCVWCPHFQNIIFGNVTKLRLFLVLGIAESTVPGIQ
jgi:hypothetical protein